MIVVNVEAGAVVVTEADPTGDIDDAADITAEDTCEATLDTAEYAEALEVAGVLTEMLDDGVALFGQDKSKSGVPKMSVGLTRENDTSADVACPSSSVNHHRLRLLPRTLQATSRQYCCALVVDAVAAPD